MYSTGPLQAGNRVNNHLRNAGIYILIIQVTEKIEQCMLRAYCGGQCVQHSVEVSVYSTTSVVHTCMQMCKKRKCSWGGSNSRPSDYETDALPTELQKHIICWCTGIKQGITSGNSKIKYVCIKSVLFTPSTPHIHERYSKPSGIRAEV